MRSCAETRIEVARRDAGRSMPLAPVAVFVFRRPEHVRRLLASLAENPEAVRCEVRVFADGPRSAADEPAVEETRAIVRAAPFPNLVLVERDANVGLSRNLIDGISRVCAEFGRVVVLEDDLVLSRDFLAYANAALERYRDDERVMHVSGYMYDIDLGVSGDTVFLPFISSWGWATWDRAWRRFDPEARFARRVLSGSVLRHRFDLSGSFGFSKMLEAQLAGRIDSWDICWYLSVFEHDGLALFPTRSLVENSGAGPGATHTEGDEGSALFRGRAHELAVREFPEPAVDVRALARVRRLFERERSLPVRMSRRARRLWRRFARA